MSAVKLSVSSGSRRRQCNRPLGGRSRAFGYVGYCYANVSTSISTRFYLLPLGLVFVINRQRMVGVVPEAGEVFHDEEGNTSTVLPDGCDPNYNPPEDELREYAEFLGIDPDDEKHLLWIALEGLRTPLPGEWRACQTGDEEVYYFNFETGESLWDHPMDDVFKKKVTTERAKWSASQQKGSETKSFGSAAAAAAASPPGQSGGPRDDVKKTESRTKAITASLLGQPAPTASSSAKSGHLSSLSPGASLSALRTAPDVSDLLRPSSTSTSPGSGLNQRAAPSLASNTGKLPMTAMEAEMAIRRRIEAEFDSILKAERRSHEQEYGTVRAQLETSLQSVKREAAAAEERYAASSSPSAEVEAEVKEVQRKWEDRLERAKQLIHQREEELKKRSLAASAAPPTEDTFDLGDYERKVRAENEKRVAEAREEAQVKVKRAASALQEEQRRSLDALSKRSEGFLASTKRQIEDDGAAAILEVQSNSQKELAAMMNELTAIREDTKRLKEEALKAKANTSSSSATAKRTLASMRAQEKSRASSVSGSTAVQEAQAKADAAVKAVDDELDDEMTRIEEEFTAQQRQLQRELDELKRGAAEPSSSSSPGDGALPPDVAKKLAAEEAQLKEEAAKQCEAYETETRRLVLAATKKTPAPSASASASSAAASAKVFSVEKAKQLHVQQLKQLEFAHEQAIRKIKDSHSRQLASQNTTNGRNSAEFTKLLNERKKSWIALNPTPSYHVEELPSVEELEGKALGALNPISDDEVMREAKKHMKPSSLSSSFHEEVSAAAATTSRRLQAYEEELRQLSRERLQAKEAEQRVAMAAAAEAEQRRRSEEEEEVAELRRRIERVEKETATAREQCHAPPAAVLESHVSVQKTHARKSSIDRSQMILREEAEEERRQLQARWNQAIRDIFHSITSEQFQAALLRRVEKPPVVPLARGEETAMTPNEKDRRTSAELTGGERHPPVRANTPYGVAGVSRISVPSTPTNKVGQETPELGPPAGAAFIDNVELAAFQRMRERKRLLREKQKALQLLRVEWKRDFYHASEAQDSHALRTLKQARRRLEGVARAMNEAVIALRLEKEQWSEAARLHAVGAEGYSTFFRHPPTSYYPGNAAVPQQHVSHHDHLGSLSDLLLGKSSGSEFMMHHPNSADWEMELDEAWATPQHRSRSVEEDALWRKTNYRNQVENWLQQQST